MHKIHTFVLTGISVFTMVARSDNKDVTPPIAKVRQKEHFIHGELRVDPYFWLRERDQPGVRAYLEAENAYTNRLMKPTEALQETLYNEMVGRLKETDLTVPVKMDNYFYYTRTEKGKQYPIHCRKKGTLDAEEEILLDQNQLAAGKAYFRIGVFEVSPNHQLLAYSIDSTGSETYTIYVKDLSTAQTFPDEIPNTYYSVEWANDNQTIFYTTLDESKRPFKLYKHLLGKSPSEDELIHFEEDEAYYLWLSKTKSKQYLLLSLESNSTTEAWFLNANQPDERFKLIHPRQHEMEYYVDHHGDQFYIWTNDQARNFRLVKTPVSHPDRKHWTEVVPHRDSVKIDDIDLFKNHLVLHERENGLKRIRITDLRTHATHYVDFPEPVYTYWQNENPEFDTATLRFTYTSLVTPRSVFDYNMADQSRVLKKQDEVLGGYNLSDYQSERIFGKASDGTRIPISLVYRKGAVRDGSHPLFLYGYGAYGISIDPGFNSQRVSLLDRGFIYAIAHVRGGGEMGRSWYEQGKLLNKMNTFTDFIACAEHLIHEKYTIPDNLVMAGGSAGGLLVGAVANLRPDLFKAVIAKVPFVDVINTMLDASLPLTITEYEEWGNPNDQTHYDYLKTYSPYDNVAARSYPNILITAGLNDPRVPYWEAAKWTAKLRANKTDHNRLLLKTYLGAGHSGSSGRYDYLKDTAFEYAFILDVMGITE